MHAYGEAIDVNGVQNPYIDGSPVIPPAGKAYLDRADVRPGMAVPGGPLVEAFAAVGWKWGGRWSPGTDYQHFSLTGGWTPAFAPFRVGNLASRPWTSTEVLRL